MHSNGFLQNKRFLENVCGNSVSIPKTTQGLSCSSLDEYVMLYRAMSQCFHDEQIVKIPLLRISLNPCGLVSYQSLVFKKDRHSTCLYYKQLKINNMKQFKDSPNIKDNANKARALFNRKTILPITLVVVLSFIIFNVFSQSVVKVKPNLETSKAPEYSFKVTQLSSTTWNTPTGLPYRTGPGVNLGATSFAIVDANRVAYLCNSTNEVFITGLKDGKVITKFSVGSDPRDFVYDKGEFYVLNDFAVSSYDVTGKLTGTFGYSKQYLGVVRMTRYNHEIYLLLPSGNSLLIATAGKAVTASETEGWITSTGSRVITNINGDNTYAITVITAEGVRLQNTFQTDKKIAGVFPVGMTAGRVILDVQTFISESPISVERQIVGTLFSPTGLEKAVSEIKVPNVYYVLSSKDFLISDSGTLYNMVTAPEGVFLFALKESSSGESNTSNYPSFIATQSYHFNDHLNPEGK